MDFSQDPFWIQIHNIPFKFTTKDVARKLGSCLEATVEVDDVWEDDWSGPFLRVRVAINLTKPLRRGFQIEIDSGSKIWCPIMYEWLPDFCYICGLIGHTNRDCDMFVDPQNTRLRYQYGDWLGATPIKRASSAKMKSITSLIGVALYGRMMFLSTCRRFQITTLMVMCRITIFIGTLLGFMVAQKRRGNLPLGVFLNV